ncbi:MAG: hypothetical protein WAN65_08450 [Candidatus Sulfotelmatobacter sp.]
MSDPFMARIKVLEAALRKARDAWIEQLEIDLGACCHLLDGEPDESTIDAHSKPMIDATRALIAEMNEALGEAK